MNPSDHTVLGCIDITGPADKVGSEAMVLAISITQSIGSDLFVMQLGNREKLRLAYRDLQMKWPNDASLVVDEHGFIIDLNSHANNLLNSSSWILNQAIQLSFPTLTADIKVCINEGIEKTDEVELENTVMGNARFLLKPIKLNGGPLGCFIMVLSGRNVNYNISSLRSIEDGLIRKTLVQTGGNISKAAGILNIDRATIYRRRKNWR
ncbi:MAG: helix-turn-helix domain-containing protein [Proteobacteria bacterium]|nr:helix-turn-helix domain-containing protein [Pseudomonadota bacterium]